MMHDPVLQEFLEKINPLRKHITRVILFGSRARGEHRMDSDYDLLIVVPRKEDQLIDGLYESVMSVAPSWRADFLENFSRGELNA